MLNRRNVVVLALASSAVMLPIAGQARVDIDVQIAPPAPVYEAVPPPRAGYVWAPGYWSWDQGHHKHNWVKGQYIHERPGQHWVPSSWDGHDGHYHMNQGHWAHG